MEAFIKQFCKTIIPKFKNSEIICYCEEMFAERNGLEVIDQGSAYVSLFANDDDKKNDRETRLVITVKNVEVKK